MQQDARLALSLHLLNKHTILDSVLNFFKMIKSLGVKISL